MPYSVIEAKGVKVRVVSSHETRSHAVDAMGRITGSILAVQAPSGRIVATNVARSF
jgi:hypothetical protein